MAASSVTFEAEGTRFLLKIAPRDLGLVNGPPVFMHGGREFIQALGVYDHFTVAGGVPKGSKATRKRHTVIWAAEMLLDTVERDLDLLAYDYSYAFADEGDSRSSGGRSGFRVRGYYGHIDPRPKGFCTLWLPEQSPGGKGRHVEIVDLRNRKAIETDDRGLLRVYRRRADTTWNRGLPSLLLFLKQAGCPEVIIHHKE